MRALNQSVEPVPPPVNPRCGACGKILAATLIEQGIKYHIMCDPQIEMDRRNDELKQHLTNVVLWVEEHSPRSQQVEIGPSEMGNPCDQRIARTLAGMPRTNFRIDPWPAIVGTAVHKWLERAVGVYSEHYPDGTPVRKWQTEVELLLDGIIPAHSDLYTHEFDVVDYKTTSPDIHRKIKKDGPQPWYVVQGHLYGYGHRAAGRPVRDIVLAFLPRAGWLRDMYLWREPYNEQIALDAIERVYWLGNEAIRLGVLEAPVNWAQIQVTPGEHCWSCPFYVNRPAEQLPDGEGCPGTSVSGSEMEAAELKRFGKGLI